VADNFAHDHREGRFIRNSATITLVYYVTWNIRAARAYKTVTVFGYINQPDVK